PFPAPSSALDSPVSSPLAAACCLAGGDGGGRSPEGLEWRNTWERVMKNMTLGAFAFACALALASTPGRAAIFDFSVTTGDGGGLLSLILASGGLLLLGWWRRRRRIG